MAVVELLPGVSEGGGGGGGSTIKSTPKCFADNAIPWTKLLGVTAYIESRRGCVRRIEKEVGRDSSQRRRSFRRRNERRKERKLRNERNKRKSRNSGCVILSMSYHAMFEKTLSSSIFLSPFQKVFFLTEQ